MNGNSIMTRALRLYRIWNKTLGMWEDDVIYPSWDKEFAEEYVSNNPYNHDLELIEGYYQPMSNPSAYEPEVGAGSYDNIKMYTRLEDITTSQ